MGTETHVFPFVMYQGQNFYLRGPNFVYKFYDKDKLTIDALLSWRFDGYDADDSSDLDGMDDRDMTAELGASVSYKDGFGVTRFSFLNDIIGKHNGYLLRLSYEKTFRRKNLTLTPSVGLKWQSENFVNYYYGVRSKESRPSRPKYHPSDALNPFMSLRLTYKFNEQWDIFSSFQYQWLGNEISDSPIVDQCYQTSLIFGFMYGF
jgi:outer membrane protein